MKYYLLVFTGIYIVSTFLIGLLTAALSSGSSSIVSTLILSGFFTAWHFVNREKRLPSDDERIACTFIVFAVFFLLMNIETGTTKVFIDIAKQVPMWIWLIAIAFITLIEFAVFYFSYGWFARKCLDGLNKKHLK